MFLAICMKHLLDSFFKRANVKALMSWTAAVPISTRDKVDIYLYGCRVEGDIKTQDTLSGAQRKWQPRQSKKYEGTRLSPPPLPGSVSVGEG